MEDSQWIFVDQMNLKEREVLMRQEFRGSLKPEWYMSKLSLGNYQTKIEGFLSEVHGIKLFPYGGQETCVHIFWLRNCCEN